MHGDGLLAVPNRSYDLDLALQHDVKARVLLAHVEEHLSGANVLATSDARDTPDLLRREAGKHLGGAVSHGLLLADVAGRDLLLFVRGERGELVLASDRRTTTANSNDGAGDVARTLRLRGRPRLPRSLPEMRDVSSPSCFQDAG